MKPCLYCGSLHHNEKRAACPVRKFDASYYQYTGWLKYPRGRPPLTVPAAGLDFGPVDKTDPRNPNGWDFDAQDRW